jgi:hypothetical protein
MSKHTVTHVMFEDYVQPPNAINKRVTTVFAKDCEIEVLANGVRLAHGGISTFVYERKVKQVFYAEVGTEKPVEKPAPKGKPQLHLEE